MVQLPPLFSLYTRMQPPQASPINPLTPPIRLQPLHQIIQAPEVHIQNQVLDQADLTKSNSSKQVMKKVSLVESTQVISPEESLQAAIQKASPGDTLHLSSGTYTLDNLQIQNKHDLKIIGEPGTKIIGNIQINDSSDILMENIHIEGSQIRSVSQPHPTEMNVPELFINGSKNIELTGLTLNHLNGHGTQGNSVRSMLEIGSTSQDVKIKNSHFFSGAQDLKATSQDQRTLVNGIRSMGADTIIEGNTFNNVGIGIQSGGVGAILTGNQITNFSQDGIQVYGHQTQIISNTITDLLYLDSPKNGDKIAHHDAIQLWAPEPSDDRNGRYKGKYALENVQIIGNTIKSTTDPSRAYQGVLQGIAAFDGYMNGLNISHNHIETHSTQHGITINAPRASQANEFILAHNTIENQWVVNPLSDLKPTINLNVLRFKQDPQNPAEPWSWRQNDHYAVTLKNNTVQTEINIQPAIKVSQ